MMTYSCSELGSIPSSSEPLRPFSDLNRRKRIPTAPDLPETIPETKPERFSSAYEKKAKDLRRALDRVAAWELPGNEFVAEYLRDIYLCNCRPSTFQGALFAIYLLLTGVKNSGKTSLAEISKDDLEYFIEKHQDRGIMISTVRTKLNFVNAFVRHWTDEGIGDSAVCWLEGSA